MGLEPTTFCMAEPAMFTPVRVRSLKRLVCSACA
jgi:hypothetical protein